MPVAADRNLNVFDPGQRRRVEDVKMVERAVCLSCGERVLARVDVTAKDADGRPLLTCPDCGASWNSNRAPWGDAVLADQSAPDSAESFLQPLRVATYVDQRSSIVAAEGDIDIATATAFKRISLEALEIDRDRLVVDLSRVTFIDSAGIAVLISVRRKAAASATPVVLVCSSIVSRVLELAGLLVLFSTFDSVEAALA